MVVREEEVETIIYGNLRLFGFDTLLGTFQIVGAPELLADWVNTEHGRGTWTSMSTEADELSGNILKATTLMKAQSLRSAPRDGGRYHDWTTVGGHTLLTPEPDNRSGT